MRQRSGKVRWSALALLWLAALSFVSPGQGAPVSNPPPLRAVILSGEGNHDWRATASFLRQLLLDTGRFEVRVCETPAGLSVSALAPFDVVVDDYSGPRLGRTAEQALEAFVESGKGFVATQGGLAPFAGNQAGERTWPGFEKMTKISWRPNPARDALAPFTLFELKIVPSDHAITRGLKANLRTADQPLRGFTLQAGAEVLATTGQGEPLLLASSDGRGRVFCTALGHDLGSMQEKTFITTFLRGTEWAAAGTVTLPAEIGLPRPSANGVRVLVITGGHDHEAFFYGLFDGYQDIGWAAVTDSTLAFKQDIRGKYDVLVFYDFTRDLDEKGRKNLRDFVESGKGVVVLHHGILNFQKWPWWYEEVVGGLYRLERQGTIPNSTVKFGEEHLITPAGEHPITAGIGPFHVTDETYRGLFISPKIKPLLFTDNATSDRTVAWVGPCPTSRVVFLQLGHDHTPIRHPSYRAFVHNSILWTADKLK